MRWLLQQQQLQQQLQHTVATLALTAYNMQPVFYTRLAEFDGFKRWDILKDILRATL